MITLISWMISVLFAIILYKLYSFFLGVRMIRFRKFLNFSAIFLNFLRFFFNFLYDFDKNDDVSELLDEFSKSFFRWIINCLVNGFFICFCIHFLSKGWLDLTFFNVLACGFGAWFVISYKERLLK